jgi:exodeoxyribonuclease V gamma subunit
MQIHNDTCLETLAEKFIDAILSKDNFNAFSRGSAYGVKSSFLTGGSVIICESKGLQEYLQKTCADKYGIWTALTFKPLTGFLMQCAYNLSKDKKDENENVFNPHNLVWAIYKLLEGRQKTLFFANELASLFFAYQIYRPEIIKKWNKHEKYTINNADKNFEKNEEFQRNIWIKIKNEHKSEQDLSQLYDLFEKSDKKIIPKQIFIFAPLSIGMVQLKALNLLSEAGCNVNMYLYQISREYSGDTKSEKSIARLRRKSWENNKIADEDKLYWDFGNRLVANLGRCSQVLYEQIGWENLEYNNATEKADTLLGNMQRNIINDSNEKVKYQKDSSLVINSCFSSLREIEVLCDYLLNLFDKNKIITPADIAIVSPNIEIYADAIETVFARYKIPFFIADRDVKKHDKTAQLLNLLFSAIGGRYEAPDIVALFEYSMYVQDRELAASDRERLEKWVEENAVRHSLENSGGAPDYSFKTGFDQLLSGFFIIPKDNFSKNDDYCYPDIEGNQSIILGDLIIFIETLNEFEKESQKEKSIEEWDNFFRINLQVFFGYDETDFNEGNDNPYQKIIGAWDSLKKEILIGFLNNANQKIDFSVLKAALPRKVEENSMASYYLSGNISCSNIETIRAVPYKVICCIGMNSREFPRLLLAKEISLMREYKLGDKDTASEDRLMFLETICSAKENLYISWIGQNETTMDELDPCSVVVMLLNNLKEQYGTEENIVNKHPLQPFSKKYFNGTFETYDDRWIKTSNNKNFINPGLDIWEWEIKNPIFEEEMDFDILYRILCDTPKYFLRDVCNIILPEDISMLESLEPFVIDNYMEEWKLADFIINNDANDNELETYLKIQKRRGDLPDGKFAEKLIYQIIIEAKELKEKAKDENTGTYWIYPNKDRGKYRLKHWLNHLDLNLNKNEFQNTKIFLKDITIELKGMSKTEAGGIFNELRELKNKLDKKMQPIFPDAAWIYVSENNLEKAELKVFGRDEYSFGIVNSSEYARIVIGEAESFSDLGENIENKFVQYSEVLFKSYKEHINGNS